MTKVLKDGGQWTGKGRGCQWERSRMSGNMGTNQAQQRRFRCRLFLHRLAARVKGDARCITHRESKKCVVVKRFAERI